MINHRNKILAEKMLAVEGKSETPNNIQLSVKSFEKDSVILVSSTENSMVDISEARRTRPPTRLSLVDMTLDEMARRTTFRPTYFHTPDATNLEITNVILTPIRRRGRPKSSIVERQSRNMSSVLKIGTSRPSRSTVRMSEYVTQRAKTHESNQLVVVHEQQNEKGNLVDTKGDTKTDKRLLRGKRKKPPESVQVSPARHRYRTRSVSRKRQEEIFPIVLPSLPLENNEKMPDLTSSKDIMESGSKKTVSSTGIRRATDKTIISDCFTAKCDANNQDKEKTDDFTSSSDADTDRTKSGHNKLGMMQTRSSRRKCKAPSSHKTNNSQPVNTESSSESTSEYTRFKKSRTLTHNLKGTNSNVTHCTESELSESEHVTSKQNLSRYNTRSSAKKTAHKGETKSIDSTAPIVRNPAYKQTQQLEEQIGVSRQKSSSNQKDVQDPKNLDKFSFNPHINIESTKSSQLTKKITKRNIPEQTRLSPATASITQTHDPELGGTDNKDLVIQKNPHSTSESTPVVSTVPHVTRGRKRSVSKNESILHNYGNSTLYSQQTNPTTVRPSRMRSKSVQRSTKDINKMLVRSQSVPRNNIPVYRKYAEEINKFSASSTNLIVVSPSNTAQKDDIYNFPSNGSSDDDKYTKQRSIMKRKATFNGTRKRTTPAKREPPCVFGTDMKRINHIVKKIGHSVRKQTQFKDIPVSSANNVPLGTTEAPADDVMTPRCLSPALSNDCIKENVQCGSIENDIPDIVGPIPVHTPIPSYTIEENAVPVVLTSDKATPLQAAANFKPLSASSPWRVLSEEVLPRTHYFPCAKDRLPSYDNTLADRYTQSPRSAVPGPLKNPTALAPVPVQRMQEIFNEIQKSYEQLQRTSEMSQKLIGAMRNYKSHIHNQTQSMNRTSDVPSEGEQLFAQFKQYETNMKNTYEKLKQWYERSRRALRKSLKNIEQASKMPQTDEQQKILENFRRDSQRFAGMINELQEAMNDSNTENVSPPRATDSRRTKTSFADIVVREPQENGRKRSPLKLLTVLNVPLNVSPIKSPLVKASLFGPHVNSIKQDSILSRQRFNKLSLTKPPSLISSETTSIPSHATDISKHLQQVPTPPMSPILPQATDQAQKGTEDLFGFEVDSESPDSLGQPITPKITKQTLKERLQSVRKLLHPRPLASAEKRANLHVPNVFQSPRRKRVGGFYNSSTPFAYKQTTSKSSNQQLDSNCDLSGIDCEPARKEAPSTQSKTNSPLIVLFDEPTRTPPVNRTYTRILQRKRPRDRNQNIAYEYNDSDPDDADNPPKKAKRRRVATSKKRKANVEQSKEFQSFVNEFNSMCEEVNRYQLIIEREPAEQRTA